MAQQNGQPSNEQATIVKGKSPRNALIGVGAAAALVIGSIGFYYQLKASNEAAEEASLQKKAKAAEVVDHSNNTQDVDKIIADQQAEARKEAAKQKRAASDAAATGAGHVPPALTADRFIQDQQNGQVKQQNDQNAIFDSPIFRPGVRIKDQAPQQQQPAIPGITTPQQMAAMQAAAQQSALGSAGEQAAEMLAAKAGQQQGAMTTQQRDTGFIRSVAQQSEGGQDFASSGFVGQARGCTLSPPHHIPVLSIEGLNSDRPGTASLMVEQDVYDSIRGDCLMIPAGTMITAPYSSDIQPGQESILVAATEMRLPNGKHVPLYGAQGADADGTAGFSGDVNNHFLKIYGTSFLTAVLLKRFDGGDTSTTTSPYGVTRVGSTAGQVAATTTQSILNRYQNIPPTITSGPGERHFMIKVSRDIHLEPYRND